LGKREKLLARLLSRPTDFTFEELTTLLQSCGYRLAAAGKTGGSRVAFTDDQGDYIRLHKPHPRNVLKRYQVADILAALQARNLLEETL
jgi:hypothetical protein